MTEEDLMFTCKDVLLLFYQIMKSAIANLAGLLVVGQW